MAGERWHLYGCVIVFCRMRFSFSHHLQPNTVISLHLCIYMLAITPSHHFPTHATDVTTYLLFYPFPDDRLWGPLRSCSQRARLLDSGGLRWYRWSAMGSRLGSRPFPAIYCSALRAAKSSRTLWLPFCLRQTPTQMQLNSYCDYCPASFCCNNRVRERRTGK
jgi:hypothetical protein